MIFAGVEVPLWLILATGTTYLLYKYCTRTFHLFKNAEIPGPKPWPLIGTSMELYGDNLMNSDTKAWKKYGNFVGTFEGTLPVLLVFDAEWLKEAFIKNFSSFTNRRVVLFGGDLDHGLFNIGGDHWKQSRKMLSPEFSSGKLKKMVPAIRRCDEAFVKFLREAKGEPVDVRRRTNLLTLDVISQTAFGIDMEAQTNENSPYVTYAFRMLNALEVDGSSLLEKLRLGIAFALILLAPSWFMILICKVFNIGLLDADSTKYFEDLCDSIIETRKKDTPGNDFLQTLADNVVDVTSSETMVDHLGFKWTPKGMTKSEVVGNALLFLLAGFQTTADTSLFIFYELAHHPDIQQKLYEEIMEVCDTEEITVEQVNQLKYLEYCINESMRLYPQGFRFDRLASEDITIRDIHVPKGTAVTASAWVIHRDPEVWENPEDFDPERFTPERFTERCSSAFMPFGIGNRQCIGNRLALLEMKMSIICTLKNFTIEKIPQTPARPCKFKAALGIFPEETIMVSFMERT